MSVLVHFSCLYDGLVPSAVRNHNQLLAIKLEICKFANSMASFLLHPDLSVRRVIGELSYLTMTVFHASRCGSQLKIATPWSSSTMTSSQFLRMSWCLICCSLKVVTLCRVATSAMTSLSVSTRHDSSGQRRATPPPRACCAVQCQRLFLSEGPNSSRSNRGGMTAANGGPCEL